MVDKSQVTDSIFDDINSDDNPLEDELFDDEMLDDINLNLDNDQIEPFDPRKVDVAIVVTSIGSIIERLKFQEIDLMPDFQRSPDLWKKQDQSRLIESILINLPIPAFYFDVLDHDHWQVVDGLQRLSAIKNFVIDEKFALTGLEFLNEYEGKVYSELPRSLQRRLNEYQISVNLIKPGTPIEMKYSLFNRINTGGLKLTSQEIRHAMSLSIDNGDASRFLKELVDTSIFKKVVGKNDRRMSYQELVLRHLTFKIMGVESYKSSLPKYLDLGMIELAKLELFELRKLGQCFLRSLEIADEIFGIHAFKKTLADSKLKKVVNKPLFESISVIFSNLDDNEVKILIEKKKEFTANFKELLEDPGFLTAISRSTANTDSVIMRFNYIYNLTNNVIHGL